MSENMDETKFEPGTFDVIRMHSPEIGLLSSIAVSLKRIADATEREEVTGEPHADE